jgi:hypothetical protein
MSAPDDHDSEGHCIMNALSDYQRRANTFDGGLAFLFAGLCLVAVIWAG